MLRSAKVLQAVTRKFNTSRLFATTNDYVVKPAEDSDCLKIASLFVTTFVIDARLESDVTLDEEYEAVMAKRSVSKFTHPLYSFFVAKKANEHGEPTVVGAIELLTKVNAAKEVFHERSPNPMWTVSDTSYDDALIDKIVVARSARGQGIGRSLIERAVQHAQENHANRLFAHVGAFNEASRGAFEKMGFKAVSYDKWMGNLEYVYGKHLRKVD